MQHKTVLSRLLTSLLCRETEERFVQWLMGQVEKKGCAVRHLAPEAMHEYPSRWEKKG